MALQRLQENVVKDPKQRIKFTPDEARELAELLGKKDELPQPWVTRFRTAVQTARAGISIVKTLGTTQGGNTHTRLKSDFGLTVDVKKKKAEHPSVTMLADAIRGLEKELTPPQQLRRGGYTAPGSHKPER